MLKGKNKNNAKRIKLLAGILLFVLLSCNESGVEPSISKVEFLGFEDKLALKLLFSEPYLYVCAGIDGLWRKEVNSLSEWEYLGLSNKDLNKSLPRGVLDAAIINNDIIIAYNESDESVKPENSVGIWRSINGGKDWFRSDNGIPATINSVYEYNTISALERSPHNESLLYSLVAPAVYKSDDNGYSWKLIKEQRGLLHTQGNLKFNPNNKGEIWFYGEDATMAPFLYFTKDFGKNFSEYVNFINFGFYSDNNVIDVSFDATNPEIIFAVTLQGIIKSTDGGFHWSRIIPDNLDGNNIRLIENAGKSNEFYALGGQQIYHSKDGLKSVDMIAKILSGFIISSKIDLELKRLFIGTTKGIYYMTIDHEFTKME